MEPLFRLALSIAVFVSAGLSHAAAGQPVDADASPEPIAELKEADRDQIYAAAQFATAETLFDSGDLDQALWRYQRAWRWGPSTAKPLAKIVPLAFSIGRVDEAVRYAQLDAASADPPLLRRLAQYLSEQREYEGARRLYQLWLDKTGGDKTLDSSAQVVRSMIRLEVARLEYMLDDAQAASKSFAQVQQAAMLNPNSDAGKSLNRVLDGLWALVATCHIEAGESALAEQALAQLAGVPDEVPRVELWRAQLAADDDQPLVAYDRLKNYFASGDRSRGDEPYRLLARVLERLNDREGLVRDLEKLVESGDPYAKASLADAKAAAGDGKAAEAIYRELLTESVGDELLAVQAADWIIRHLSAEGRQIDLVDSLPALGSAVDDFSPLNAALDVALEQGQPARRLTRRLQRLPTKGQSFGTLAAAAWIARRAGLKEDARRFHEAGLQQASDQAGDRALAWAIDLLMEDQPADAAQALQQGIDAQRWSPDDPAPHFYLATALAMSDQHEAALTAAGTAAELAEDNADIVSRVAWVLFNADRVDEAIDEYRRVIEKFDADPDPASREVVKDARMVLSYLLLDRGEVDPAAEQLERVLDEFPGDIGAMNDLAYLWADNGKHLNRAFRMAKQAVSAEPESAAYLDTLAWTQFRLGDFPAALVTIAKAIERDRASAGDDFADGEILDHQGDILAALGRREKASAVWRQAAEQLSDRDPKRAAKIRQKLAADQP